MTDEQSMLNPVETPAEKTPREVVLRYDAPAPQPVVERYIQPTPLPGRKPDAVEASPPYIADASRYVFTPPEEIPTRSRTGLRIFLVCLAAVLVVVGVVAAQAARRAASYRAQQPDVYHYETERRNEQYDYSDLETTIERYPIGDNVRLRCSESHGDELSIQEVYERVNPSTVTVAAALPGGNAIIGAGVIFTSDGYILTNAHVIAGGNECYAVLDTGRSYPAKLVGYDTKQDLAVIKVDGQNLPVAEFGDSDGLTVGDTVYAIGNPLGVQLRGTLTNGIVSAINRDVLVDGVKMTLIQTNAALNNGNSGGPLINAYGQVVGINTMKIGSGSTVSVEGLGFAIPISSAAWMIDDLIEYGEVRAEPVLGVSVLRASVTLNTGETALQVYEITPNSAADLAGLAPGDCLVYADGEPLASVSDLLRVRRRHRIGDVLTLEIERYSKRITVDVILKELPT